LQLKKENPGVEVLAHPECKAPILAQSDVIGSTKALLEHTIKSPAKRFIIATESGILHEMQKACLDKEFIPVPPEVTEGIGCSCNECEYMRMNTLEKVYACLRDGKPEMHVNKETAAKAVSSINRMLEMS
jgi:quinolinate synthase